MNEKLKVNTENVNKILDLLKLQIDFDKAIKELELRHSLELAMHRKDIEIILTSINVENENKIIIRIRNTKNLTIDQLDSFSENEDMCYNFELDKEKIKEAMANDNEDYYWDEAFKEGLADITLIADLQITLNKDLTLYSYFASAYTRATMYGSYRLNQVRAIGIKEQENDARTSVQYEWIKDSNLSHPFVGSYTIRL